MKHVDRIVLDGEEEIYGISVGYCSDIGSYVVRIQSGWVYDYKLYYSISAQEYENIKENIGALNDNGISLQQIIPQYHDRYIGAGYSRGYDIVPYKYRPGCTPFTYRDGPFLCDDGVFYFHLYWQGHHYAAVPRLWNACIKVDDKRCWTGPYRDREDISLIKIPYDGEEISMCYGKEIFEFEGREEWCELYNQSLLKVPKNS